MLGDGQPHININYNTIIMYSIIIVYAILLILFGFK